MIVNVPDIPHRKLQNGLYRIRFDMIYGIIRGVIKVIFTNETRGHSDDGRCLDAGCGESGGVSPSAPEWDRASL
jgi:hypothetical protein